MFVHQVLALNDLTNLVLLRVLTSSHVRILFSSIDDLLDKITVLKCSLLSCLFLFENTYISKSTALGSVKSKFWAVVCSTYSKSIIPSARLVFSYDWDSESPSVPVIRISQSKSRLKSIHVPIDVVCCLKRDISSDEIPSALCQAISDYLDNFQKAVVYCSHQSDVHDLKIRPYHHLLESFLVTTFYPKAVAEEQEHAYRMDVHKTLNLSMDKPLLRRSQALHPVPYLTDWLGPSAELLVCPHESLKPPPGRGSYFIVQGRYTYKHYMQDQTDDKNWGCAYRSLQTLISWLMWQGEIECRPLPSLKDIQDSLVRVGDKPKRFVGSRQWIGSLEVSYCIQELYNVQCRIFPISRGSEMSTQAASQLAQHFAAGGGPVMIGGGQLAHTIIGVQLPTEVAIGTAEKPSHTRYLILDPHFTGPSGHLQTVLDKGWCGWKEPSFWKPDVHYNMCFLPPVKRGRV